MQIKKHILICRDLGWETQENGKRISLKIFTPRKEIVLIDVGKDNFLEDIRGFAERFRKIDYLHSKITILSVKASLLDCIRVLRDAYWLEKTLRRLSKNLGTDILSKTAH